jgi:hypothetical protein
MSVHVISWVLRNSEARLGARLALLVLADHAHQDGTNAFPSVATIGKEARMSARNVQYALRRLVSDGSIELTGQRPTKDGWVNVYKVVMDPPAQDLQGVQDTTAIVSDLAPEPSLEPSNPSSLSSVAKDAEEGEREFHVPNIVETDFLRRMP